ncbi:MAG: bacillithiol biosynthesis cysteine-adding enzyme BshC, partial [Saprospiraceae bacterium]|nr:bacillithiol biosynthesis cysteine-adding enzyme BshC [Saprospiraceae bacterium]
MLVHKTLLPFDQVPQLAKTDVAYATGDERLKPFYVHEAQPGAFTEVIRTKAQQSFPRAELVAVLKQQYAQLPEQSEVLANIDALSHEDTFTVATAHQPSLLLGPLYFIYKALTTINLAERVQQETGRRIVPVFVLGSEDHDIEEVNKINLFGKRLVWQPETEGPTGSMDTASLQPVLEELRGILGESESAAALFGRVQRACASARDFAGTTRALLHELLGKYGLVVVDMNDASLKRHFIPVIQAELQEQTAFHLVNQTIAQLNQLGFKTQAAPREINLFYMKPGLRQRIVLEGGTYQVLQTNLSFSEAEILAELDRHPERFSPNVVLRPLYQEMILPNLAYIGGGGELAYWLERRSLFQHFNIAFPVLLRRNSVLWLDRDAQKKLGKFGFSAAQFFEDTEPLVRRYIETNASGDVSLAQEINHLRQVYDQIAAKA